MLVLVALFWLAFAAWRGAATLAFFCILYGAVSDFLDGWLARRCGAISNLGKILDALVDKVMVLGAMALLIVVGIMQPAWLMWILVGLIALREAAITVLRMVAARRGIILAAETAGKRKTIWQTTTVCVFFGVPMFERDFAAWLGADLDLFANYVWLNGMFYLALSLWLTLSSGVHYLGRYAGVLRPGNPRHA